jgi:hypothetical protein
MELEALQQIDSDARTMGARIVVITPELERYTRALHNKAEPVIRYSDGSSPKARGAVSARFHIARLLARPLQILWKHFGQIQ